jgi:Arc/MetJ-type ribon-helix-helix transcriptional regulator
VVKTTVYLPEELKLRVERTARLRKTSEADVIRAALEEYTRDREPPRPRYPLFSGEPIEDWDEAMRGFGED